LSFFEIMSENFEMQFIQIINNEKWLMEALRCVRSLNLPDWYIAGGAIRNTVWNVLHGYDGSSNIKDIDIAYFDVLDTSSKREIESENELKKLNPSQQVIIIFLVNKRPCEPFKCPTRFNSRPM